MKSIFLAAVYLLLLISNCRAQDLLSVNWQKVVCENGYIDHLQKILTDKNGNTYTLGSFPNEARILGENLTSANGANFLTKQNSKGEKIYVRTFGNSRVNLAEGDMEFSTNGDIVFSLDFRDSFYFDGKILVHGDEFRINCIILKVDSNFNLKWFKTFPKSFVPRITNLILDEENNIYCNFRFLKFIDVDGNKYYNDGEHYSDLFVKFDTDGKVKWARHFSASMNSLFILGKFCDSSEYEIIILGKARDSLTIDNVLYEKYNDLKSPPYLCILSLTGDVVLSRFLDISVLGTEAMKMYNNRLFFAGEYSESMFIGELSNKGEISGLVNFKTKERCYVTDFNISPLYGFVVSGCFDGSFALQHVSRTLLGEYERGSFIASFDDTLNLYDCKFIDGGSYNLRRILIDSNIITGAGIFDRNCSFSNTNIFGWNEDISVFQTTNLKPLMHFMPDTLPQPPEVNPDPVDVEPLYVNVYPNPFIDKFNIVFNQKAEVSSIILTDAIGKLIPNIRIYNLSETEFYIDASELPAGFYILQFNANESQYLYKLIKIGK